MAKKEPLDGATLQSVSENGSNGEGGMVEVVLVEARHLIAADWGGTSDPYVSVCYGNIKMCTKSVSENESNGECGIIEVVLLEARDLIAADWGGTSDPYVSAHYGNIKMRTKVVYKILAPTWGQTFEFIVDGSPLVLNVRDYNLILPTISIGYCEVEYDQLPPNHTLDQWLPLQGVNRGEIHIQVTRRVPYNLLKNFDLTKFASTPSSNTKLHGSARKVHATNIGSSFSWYILGI